MIELSADNVVEYLRTAGRASVGGGEILVQSLSGGVANIVLKIFDTGAGERVGTDLRTPGQKKLGKPDTRPCQGLTFVLKQPLPRFRTAAEWVVDIARVLVERDCMQLLSGLLPEGSVPAVLWFDEPNYILAMSAAPVDAVIWKKELLAGRVSMDAATHAGMLLAMLHSSTAGDAAVAARYGDPKFFIEQRIDPYLHTAGDKNPAVGGILRELGSKLIAAPGLCLIHGDFSPKNIFLIRDPAAEAETAAGMERKTKSAFPLAHLMLLDFEVAFYGHPAFDVATLINHLLLKGFFHRRRWRPFMLAADDFWQTYRHTADQDLLRAVDAVAGRVLGALMLARIDGKSPVEYLVGEPAVQDQVRRAALDVLGQSDASLDHAMDTVSTHYDEPE